MMKLTKNDLISSFLEEDISNGKTKIGYLLKGISNISPIEISEQIQKRTEKKVFLISVGYSETVTDNDNIIYYEQIEKAVELRSIRDLSGIILTFVREDVDKLHSLAEFEKVTSKMLKEFLLLKEIEKSTNVPVRNFWIAINKRNDLFSLDSIINFIAVLSSDESKIPQNMWILNLLNDEGILSTNNSALDRIEKNRQYIEKISQLTAESRKRISLSIKRANANNREQLMRTNKKLKDYFKYGNPDTLREISYDDVFKLISATSNSKKTSNKKKQNTNSSKPIKIKEFDDIISTALLSNDADDRELIRDIYEEIEESFKSEQPVEIDPKGGIFEDRKIIFNSINQDEFRKILGQLSNATAWGGVIKSKLYTLKEVLSSEPESLFPFLPNSYNNEEMIQFDKSSVFDFLYRFDDHIGKNINDDFGKFREIIDVLISSREKLAEKLDLILNFPILAFGVDLELRKEMITFIETWDRLLKVFLDREPQMHQISPEGTKFISESLVMLDVIYIKTPTEWKGLLTPLHPLHLWRYYEIFKDFEVSTDELNEEDKSMLQSVVNDLPQVLNVLVVGDKITGDEKRDLPCSGCFNRLPTFENKTNKYLGEDGVEGIAETLYRWLAFAPYTKNELRICTIDVPDPQQVITDLSDLISSKQVERIVYHSYFTRKQNPNAFLSELDYSGEDYYVADYLRSGKLELSMKNIEELSEINKDLKNSPVHVAFYFDQSAYATQYVNTNKKLYISPLVVSYDYEFDEITQKGSIFPSNDMDSGLISDYHEVLRKSDSSSSRAGSIVLKHQSGRDLSEVVQTLEDGLTQWLFIADREVNDYMPTSSFPIGEKRYGRRMSAIWTSDNSRVINQYDDLLRRYNLEPNNDYLIKLLSDFGHISSEGLISIPKNNSSGQRLDRQKGLIGTLFAAKWFYDRYGGENGSAVVASLDTKDARIWLSDQRDSKERADLIGLHFDSEQNTLNIIPIEVKTRDENSPQMKLDDTKDSISGHASDQVAWTIQKVKEIFGIVNSDTDRMFVSARKEVLKYQIISECFRDIYKPDVQKKWSNITKEAFSESSEKGFFIKVTGMLVHVKLSEAKSGKEKDYTHTETGEKIKLVELSAKDIQEQLIDGVKKVRLESVNVNEPDLVVVDPAATYDDSSSINEVKERDTKNKFYTEKTDFFSDTQKNQSEENLKMIADLANSFKQACQSYHIELSNIDLEKSVIGSSIIRIYFKLARGQSIQPLRKNLEDIGREMERSGILVQSIPNSNELVLDIPKRKRDAVLFSEVIDQISITSPEQLRFAVGRTPEGQEVFANLEELPHLLVGGSTGSGKTVFLWTILISLLRTHPDPKDITILLSSSGMEDFVHFENLPHLMNGEVISDVEKATEIITKTVIEEFDRREKILKEAKVSNIVEYNAKYNEKLSPMVVIIDEFADLSEQFTTNKDKEEFFKPVKRIAQIGRKRGIYLVLCTQRPAANLVPTNIKSQIVGRAALRVNDANSSRMILEETGAEQLQNKGDMIFKDVNQNLQRLQGYYLSTQELIDYVEDLKSRLRKLD